MKWVTILFPSWLCTRSYVFLLRREIHFSFPSFAKQQRKWQRNSLGILTLQATCKVNPVFKPRDIYTLVQWSSHASKCSTWNLMSSSPLCTLHVSITSLCPSLCSLPLVLALGTPERSLASFRHSYTLSCSTFSLLATLTTYSLDIKGNQCHWPYIFFTSREGSSHPAFCQSQEAHQRFTSAAVSWAVGMLPFICRVLHNPMYACFFWVSRIISEPTLWKMIPKVRGKEVDQGGKDTLEQGTAQRLLCCSIMIAGGELDLSHPMSCYHQSLPFLRWPTLRREGWEIHHCPKLPLLNLPVRDGEERIFGEMTVDHHAAASHKHWRRVGKTKFRTVFYSRLQGPGSLQSSDRSTQRYVHTQALNFFQE